MAKTSRAPKNAGQPGRKAPVQPAAGADDWRTVWGICLFLAAITFTIFGQTLRHEFVNYDDDRYVYEDAVVSKGITSAGIAHAFAQGSWANWDPLTTLSHMLDCQFYGLHAGGHHLTNVLLHIASVILLFLALRKMTGGLWQSAFVAAVFAIHPLHVQSVAWVAERKDTLSGFFFMLTLWAYARYVKNPGFPRCLPVILFFACGLMSKSMLVTLPFVLLLLDYWPLKRIGDLRFTIYESTVTGTTSGQGGRKRFSALARAVIEKLPLVAISAAGAVLAFQKRAISLEQYPFGVRLANAVFSVANYIRQMFWPSGLAVLYPYPDHGLPVVEVSIAAIVLIGISVVAWCWRRTRPYVLVGWLWYLAMLVPVMGLIQVGGQARADRYTYLPQIGLYIALTWLAAGATTGWRNRRIIFGSVAGGAIAALAAMAFIQTTYWRNSETLWKHTLACTQNNVIAHNNLGTFEWSKGRTDDALMEFQKAVESRPDYAQAHANLGMALLKERRVDDAVTEYQKALELRPGDAGFSAGLGTALLERGSLDEAVAAFAKSVAIRPDVFDVHNNFGIALSRLGRLDAAAAEFLQAMALKPDSVTARKNLAAIVWALAAGTDDSVRNGPKAVELAEKVDRLSGGNDPVLVSVLAAAYAEAGRFPEAVATAERAQQLAAVRGNSAVAAAVREQLGYYQSGRPVRDPGAHIGPLPVTR
jgi:Flp pilus assembly protein TadD